MNEVFAGIMVLAIGILSLASGFCPIPNEKNKILIQMPQKVKAVCLLNVLNQPDGPPSHSPINSGASTYSYVSATGTTGPSPSLEIPGTTTTTT